MAEEQFLSICIIFGSILVLVLAALPGQRDSLIIRVIASMASPDIDQLNSK